MNSLFRLPSVINATGLSRPTIYRYIKQGLLPTPVKISERAVAWPVAEISAINAARIAGKSDDEVRELVIKLEQQRAVTA